MPQMYIHYIDQIEHLTRLVDPILQDDVFPQQTQLGQYYPWLLVIPELDRQSNRYTGWPTPPSLVVALRDRNQLANAIFFGSPWVGTRKHFSFLPYVYLPTKQAHWRTVAPAPNVPTYTIATHHLSKKGSCCCWRWWRWRWRVNNCENLHFPSERLKGVVALRVHDCLWRNRYLIDIIGLVGVCICHGCAKIITWYPYFYEWIGNVMSIVLENCAEISRHWFWFVLFGMRICNTRTEPASMFTVRT